MTHTRTWRLTATAVLLVGGASLTTISPVDATETPPRGWQDPSCSTVDGDGSFSYTRDDGTTIASTSNAATPVTYGHLAALDRRNHLVGISKDTVQLSDDAGCTWRTIVQTPGNLSQYDVVAGPRDQVYVVGINAPPIYRIDGSDVSERQGPVEGNGLTELAVDQVHANKLRAVDKEGNVYDSSDGAMTWTKIADGPGVSFVYDAAIDPNDSDHIVVGTLGKAVYTSFDGGASWTQSTGIGTDHRANGFTVAVSPANPQTVWVEGYDLAQNDNGARKIWRSDDGGLTYRPVIDGLDVVLFNGTPLWPSPVDDDVLYFMYGTWFAGYGTDLYRYSTASDSVTAAHNEYDGIESVAFSPRDPSVLYLGISEVR